MNLPETLWTWGDFLTYFLTVASLHKDSKGRSGFWYASFCDAEGRWVKKSTKTKDRALAMKLAIEFELAAKSGRKGTLVVAQVRKVMGEITEQATGESLHFESVSEYLLSWVLNKEGAKAKNTAVKYKQVVESFLLSLGRRSGLSLPVIAPADVERWRSGLKKDKLTPNSVNQYVKILSSAFEKARKLGYIPINPCLALDALVVEDSEGREHFTLEQAEQLAAAAVGSDWEGVIWAAFYSGGRLQDVANLSWAEIDCTDPQKWWLRAKAKKTKALTHTPILGRFRAWLEKQRRGVGRAALFPSLANRTSGSNSGLSTEFKRLMERAGVRGRIIRQGDGKRRTTETLSFHSFRHSYASWLERNGVSEEDRMRLTGHATRKAHRNYVHSDPSILFDKLAAIEANGMAL